MGELAAIDQIGNANVGSAPASAFDSGFLAAVSGDLNLGIVLAAPMQILVTEDGVPFGAVMVPDGWDINKEGFPPGYSVSWDAGSGVSTVYDHEGKPAGKMVAPQAIFPAALPIQNFTYTGQFYNGKFVAKVTAAQWAAIKAFVAASANAMPTVTGGYTGGPDGGPSR